MQCTFTPDIDRIVHRLVAGFVLRADLTRHINNSKEDLIAEAKIAALIAIRRYDESKQVKLNTFVYECVANRLGELERYARRKKRARYICVGTNYQPYENKEIILDELKTDGEEENESKINYIIVEKILTDTEREVFRRILAGFKIAEIVKDLSRERGKRFTRQEVKQCFTRLTFKLKTQIKQTRRVG